MNVGHLFMDTAPAFMARSEPAMAMVADATLPAPNLEAIAHLAQRAAGRVTSGPADALRGVTSLRGTDAAATRDARAAIEQVLATGTPGREVAIPGARAGMNGIRRAWEFGNIDGLPVTGVIKHHREQAPQEILAARVADELGISHLMPVIGARADASVAMQFVPGDVAARHGVRNAATLEASLARWYTDMHGMTRTDAVARARLDRELMNVFDYVLANRDRHAGNVLIDHVTGGVRMIDHGLMGDGQRIMRASVAHPMLRTDFMASEHLTGHLVRTELSEATVDHLAHVNSAALREAHAGIAAIDNPEHMNSGAGRGWAIVQSSAFGDHMVERLDRARNDGAIVFSNM